MFLGIRPSAETIDELELIHECNASCQLADVNPDQSGFALHELQTTTHRLKPTLNRLQRSRKREAHVSFAMWPKDNARHRGDLCLVQKDFRGGATIGTD